MDIMTIVDLPEGGFAGYRWDRATRTVTWLTPGVNKTFASAEAARRAAEAFGFEVVDAEW